MLAVQLASQLWSPSDRYPGSPAGLRQGGGEDFRPLLSVLLFYPPEEGGYPELFLRGRGEGGALQRSKPCRLPLPPGACPAECP